VADGNALYVIGGHDGGVNPLNDVWKSNDAGVKWSRVLRDTGNPGNTQFSRREDHAAVSHDDALYVIGGHDGTNYLNDVWKSNDAGKTWIEVLGDTGNPGNNQFPRRYLHAAVAHGGDLYIIGGHDDRNYLNDVWKSSDDGKTWIEVLKDTGNPGNTQFSRRTYHSVSVMGGALYVIGGYDYDSGNRLNDVWKSNDDGKTWIEVLGDTGNPGNNQFSRRYLHAAVAHGGDLYIIGGYNHIKFFNDVWKSSDGGQTWSQVLGDTGNPGNARFSRRSEHAALVVGNALYVIGGSDDTNRFKDVWRSADGGATWAQGITR